jgi:hypothetical protein
LLLLKCNRSIEGGEHLIGLDAITANNGWAMAATGAVIVMSGLAILSLVLSQLYKIIALFEKQKQSEPDALPAAAAPSTILLKAAEADILNDLDAAARIYKTMTEDQFGTFKLQTLYAKCQHEKIPHPHLTISALRAAGFLVACGDGTYRWEES